MEKMHNHSVVLWYSDQHEHLKEASLKDLIIGMIN